MALKISLQEAVCKDKPQGHWHMCFWVPSPYIVILAYIHIGRPGGSPPPQEPHLHPAAGLSPAGGAPRHLHLTCVCVSVSLEGRT